MLITRLKPMSLDDSTTRGIIGNLIGVDPMTVREYCRKGMLPCQQATGPSGTYTIIRVRDAVVFAVKNGLTLDKQYIRNSDQLPTLDSIKNIKHVYYYGEAIYSKPEMPWIDASILTPVSTWELFHFVRYDPYAVFAFKSGMETRFLMNEVRTMMQPFKPTVWLVHHARGGYPASDIDCDKTFESTMHMIDYLAKNTRENVK